VIRAKNYNLTAIILIAVSIVVAVFAVVQFTGKDARQQSSADQKLAQIGKDKKPKLKPGKHDAPIQASALLVPSETQEDDLPVIHKSGTLTENETWQAGYVYIIDNSVTVPDGLTLNLAAGAIVKLGSWGSSITVNTDGALNVNGTSNDPVVITSYRDDTVGGDSNSDGSSTSPAVGDYAGAIDATTDTSPIPISGACIIFPCFNSKLTLQLRQTLSFS